MTLRGLSNLPVKDLIYISLTPDVGDWYHRETREQAGKVLDKMIESGAYDRLVDEYVKYGGIPLVIEASDVFLNRFSPSGPQ